VAPEETLFDFRARTSKGAVSCRPRDGSDTPPALREKKLQKQSRGLQPKKKECRSAAAPSLLRAFLPGRKCRMGFPLDRAGRVVDEVADKAFDARAFEHEDHGLLREKDICAAESLPMRARKVRRWRGSRPLARSSPAGARQRSPRAR
jgi:hypothetical protein